MRCLLIGPAVLACAATLACNSSGGGRGDGGVITPPPGPIPVFQCSDSPAAPDTVVLQCGERISASTWRINVVIGVPTTSTDINGFDFDVVFDPLLLAYVPGSAQPGVLLSQGGGTVLFAAATSPGDPGRLVVGIHKAGATGVQGTQYLGVILAFQLRSQTAASFPPQLLGLKNFRASDSSDVTIQGITAIDQLLLSLQ